MRINIVIQNIMKNYDKEIYNIMKDFDKETYIYQYSRSLKRQEICKIIQKYKM